MIVMLWEMAHFSPSPARILVVLIVLIQSQGQSARAKIVKDASMLLENVRVEKNHCQGLVTVIPS